MTLGFAVGSAEETHLGLSGLQWETLEFAVGLGRG
jgi:hypothetical protein